MIIPIRWVIYLQKEKMLSDILHQLLFGILWVKFGQEVECNWLLLWYLLIQNLQWNQDNTVWATYFIVMLLHEKKKGKALAFLSIFSHATVSLMLYRSPKNHVSLSPRVRHTRSKRSFPFHFTYRTKQPEISTSWTILAGKFPFPSLPKFDIIAFHHKLNLPVQSLSCSRHPVTENIRHTNLF